MPVDVGRRLGLDHGVLEPSEQILGVLQTQANRLEPVTALIYGVSSKSKSIEESLRW